MNCNGHPCESPCGCRHELYGKQCVIISPSISKTALSLVLPFFFYTKVADSTIHVSPIDFPSSHHPHVLISRCKTSSNNPTHSSGGNIINPTTNRHLFSQTLMVLQELNILLEGILQISKRLEVETIIYLSSILSQGCYPIVVRKGQHPTSGVFDQDNLSSPKKVLRSQDRSQGVFRVATGVANNVRVSQCDAEGCGWVDSGVHAGHLWLDVRFRQTLPSRSLHTNKVFPRRW